MYTQSRGNFTVNFLTLRTKVNHLNSLTPSIFTMPEIEENRYSLGLGGSADFYTIYILIYIFLSSFLSRTYIIFAITKKPLSVIENN